MLTKSEIQLLRSLNEKKHRDALGLFLVEGEKSVADLIAGGCVLEDIYATAEWTGPRTREISAVEMGRISQMPTPATVLGVGRISRTPLPDGALNQGLTLALDGVQDPGNVGTLLRIADWFAFARVICSADCADLYSQKVIQASMGSFARVTAHSVDLSQALAATQAPILGCDLDGEDVHGLAPIRDAVVVVGSEGRGLSQSTRSRLTRRLTIPRYGGAESLNAAIAAAIICDNLRRAAIGSSL